MENEFSLSRSISWMGALRIVIRGLATLKFVVLARILTPGQFGIYGIALLVLGLLEILTEVGINVFLIQQKEKWEKYVDTAWIISILRGVIISSAIFLFAPIVAEIFSTREATNILRFVSIIPFIKGFINPSIVRFQKELQFRKEFLFRAFLFLIDFKIAIFLALMTYSEFSLVIAMLISAILEVAISLLLIKPRPTIFKFEMEKAKEIVKEGKWLTGAGIFEYLFQHLDDIVVGKMLGVYSLGLYQQAYRISTLPISEAGEVFNRVSLPVYSKMSADTRLLKKTFLKFTLAIAILVIPFGLFLIVWGEQIVRVFLGDIWLPAVPALRILTAFGVIKAISNSSSSLLLALKKQFNLMIITLVGIIGLAIPLVPLISLYGLEGAAYSTIIGTLLGIPYILYFLWGNFNEK